MIKRVESIDQWIQGIENLSLFYLQALLSKQFSKLWKHILDLTTFIFDTSGAAAAFIDGMIIQKGLFIKVRKKDN